jgi:hypothetical protein
MQHTTQQHAQKTHARSQAAGQNWLLDVSETEEKMYASRVAFDFDL